MLWILGQYNSRHVIKHVTLHFLNLLSINSCVESMLRPHNKSIDHSHASRAPFFFQCKNAKRDFRIFFINNNKIVLKNY